MSLLTIDYNKIYSRFLSKVEAYGLAEMLEDTAYDLMNEWIHSVRSHPKVRKIFNSFTQNDEEKTITFEIKNTQGDNESDIEYIIDLFGTGIVQKWIEPKYFSELATSQVFTGKEQKLEILIAWYHTARYIWKQYSVFLRICWKTVKLYKLQRKNEICLSVNV